MVIAFKVVEHSKSEWTTETLRPHRRVVIVVACPIEKDTNATEGLALHTAKSTI